MTTNILRAAARLLPVAVTLLTAFASCTLETSDNGDLDGFWHLERIDTLATGSVCDMSGNLVFWAVQMDLLNAADRNGRTDCLMRFDHSGDSLRVYEPRENDRMSGDPAIVDVDVLRPLGINALDETFKVEKLNSSHMTLSTADLRLSFTKM